MEIPGSLKIGGHDIRVIIEKLPDDGCGEFDPNTNTIRISSEIAASQQEATLFHEIFHALNSELDEDKVFHALMESLSQQLYQVLRENRMLR